MELYRVVLDNGVEISITKENRREFLSDPEGFKQRYIEMWRVKRMKPNELEKFIESLTQEEKCGFPEVAQRMQS